MSIKIALAGNPNCGKTTLFNAYTGSNQYVGNWPGVTVEKKEGKLQDRDDVIITDLPGIYSLSPYTPEEVVARNYLIQERPDAILNIVDGTNLERNLYLTTQMLEIGIPVIIAINMMDIVRKKGDIIHLEQLSKELKCRICEISALKSEGLDHALNLAIEAANEKKAFHPRHIYSGCVEHALAHIEEYALHDIPEEQQRWYAIKIFERDERVMKQLDLPENQKIHLEGDIKSAEEEMDDDAESIIINERYNYISAILKESYIKKNVGGLSTSDKIDRIVTHRWLGLPVFALIMFLVYYLSMVSVGAAATNWTNENLFGDGWYLFGSRFFIPSIPELIQRALESIQCAQWLQDLIIDGIIAGVGSVLGFVPQMLVLFFLLAFLEDCGYMSRIAFVLDKIFRKFGLSGKSFIPILVGTGCGVPGIMASRTIENERSRRMTIMTTTFIPCSAKVPFIALIAGAIFNGSPLVSTSAYFIGMLAIMISGCILKKTKMFQGKETPFVMELPAYHMPTWKNVMRTTWDRGWSFIKKASTVIMISTIVVWFTSNFGFTEDGFRMLSELELNHSILAAIGNCIAWIFKPLGFGTWQSAVAVFTGLIAKENILGTLSVLYSGDGSVYDALPSVYSAITAYSFLIFNLLCAPCAAAMAAISSEMKSIKWTLYAIGYQCCFAYCISLIVYQFGSFVQGNGTIIGLSSAIIVLLLLIYLCVRPDKKIRKD